MKSKYVAVVVVLLQVVSAGFSQETPGGHAFLNTPKSDVFLQGFYWNSTPGGIWWDSLARLAPRIGAAGFGAIWFPSPVKGQAGGFSMGYDPYDHYDFGEYNQKGTVETRFGSRQELINSINAFHAVGVQVFADAVMGHMNGAEQRVPVDCIPSPSYPDSAWLLFNYRNGSGRFKKNATHFYPNQITCDVNPPYHGPYDQIFKFGEVPAHTQSHVRDSLIVWGQYLRNVIGFDGFRLDAVKHIDPAFVGPWLQASGGYAVAEYYGSTSEIWDWWGWCQNVYGGTVSMFDFPLRFTLKDMCNNTSGTFDMNWLDGAGLVNAGMSGYSVATFVENHDLDRTGWDGSVDNGHAPIIYDKDMAYAYIMFAEGRPSVFFRDYFAYGLDATIDRLIWIRERFLRGSTTRRNGLNPWYVGSAGSQEEQSRDIYVARRNGGDGRPQAFLVMNDHPSQWRGVWVNSSHPNQWFRDYTGAAIDKQAAGDGRVELWAPPRGFAIYVPDTTVRVNHHPYIQFIPELSAFTNTPFQYQVIAGDPNNDALTYTLSGNPSWLNVSTSGLLNGTPSSTDTLTSQVIITVADPWGGSTADTFSVTVRSRPLMDGVFEGETVWGSPAHTADTLPGWNGAMARSLYVTEDDQYFYFGADIQARRNMNWTFLISTKPGGGSNESWSRSINYIHPNKPDYILRGHFEGYAEFHTWNGSGWSGVGSALPGADFGESITLDSLQDGWVEGRVLKSVLGNPPVMAVQFYLTGNQNSHATFDACPDDQNTTAWTGVTTNLRYYAYVGQKQITECNLQFPPSATISGGGSATVYARAYALGVTDSTGQGPGVIAWIGTSPQNTHPSTWTQWTPATYNVDAGGTDEYQTNIGADLAGGMYYYASRFQYTGGPYLYGGYSTNGGGMWNGATNNSGLLTVQAVPALPTLTSPVNGSMNVPPNVTLVWTPPPGLNTYRVQVSTDSLFGSTVLDDSTLSGNSVLVPGLVYGTQYFWRVRAKNSFGPGAFTTAWSFTVFTPEALTMPVAGGWNLLSLPLTVLDGRRSIVFPTAVSGGYAFDPIGGYVLRDSLVPGAGYWLKFNTQDSVQITGGWRAADTVHVRPGWNLIGSISAPVDVNYIGQIPDTLVRSLLYGFDGGYSPVDSVIPGKGYWVKSSSVGKLVLVEGNIATSPSRTSPLELLAGANRLTIVDATGQRQTLYFGETAGDHDILKMFELPPVPPHGIFDARYATQRLYEVVDRHDVHDDIPIQMSSAAYPITIQWQMIANSPPARLMLGDENVPMTGEGSITLSDPQMELKLGFQTVVSLPLAFTIGQNYPNPFNPATTIRFGLPHQAVVTLKVYDILGREVQTLLDGRITAPGWQNVAFDGANCASGVYFYRFSAVEAGGGLLFQGIGKMLILK